MDYLAYFSAMHLLQLTTWFSELTGLPMLAATLVPALAITAAVDLLVRTLGALLERRLGASRHRWDDALVYALRLPLGIWLWLTMAYVTILIVFDQVDSERSFEEGSLIASRWIAIATIALLGWAGVRFFHRLEQRLVSPPKGSDARPVDSNTASALSKLCGAVFFIVLLLLVMDVFKVSPRSMLAFGGASGVVVAFAARGLLVNFFGGMAVHFDKPFKVGDWIRSPDRSLEGIVEDIGWRLTRIRTFSGPPLYVPNSAFNQIIVENPNRMLSRRIWEHLRLRFEDISTVAAITDEIKQMLEEREDIDQKDVVSANLDTIDEYGILITFYVMTAQVDWQTYMNIKQDLLLNIHDIIERNGARLALPGTRLFTPEGLLLQRNGGERAGSDDHSEGRTAKSHQYEPRREERSSAAEQARAEQPGPIYRANQRASQSCEAKKHQQDEEKKNARAGQPRRD